MIEIAPGWQLEVERGPDWLFVKPHCDLESSWNSPPLAEALWELLQQGFAHRLVLECEEIPILHTLMIGQLVLLHKRISSRGGVLRICGMSERSCQVLQGCRLDDRLPNFDTRADAVHGFRPVKPR